jgi:uncharacterized protein YecE (DUF72 family)
MDTDSHNLPPQAERLATKLRDLAQQGIYFGTSSWKYEGWLGSIYRQERYLTRGKFSQRKFEAECLAEYAETFPTVCGDFAFYQFPSDEYWARLFSQTPRGFVFGFKVPEDITVETWPTHARYGMKAGKLNEHFLDATIFERFFLQRLEPFKAQVGPLIFEFGTFNKKTFPKPADFMARLDPFLTALPAGWQYAIEIRNSEYLMPDYLAMLASHNTAHVFNAWTRMPLLDDQAALPEAFTADFTVVRALLRKHQAYEKAVDAFEPYNVVQEPNEGARAGMRRIAEQAMGKKTPAYLFVNNRLEGNAPGTIEAVLNQLAM